MPMLECPVCGKVDQVQLAWVAVMVGRAGSNRTGLARTLSEPTVPKNLSVPGYYYLGWPVAAILAALFFGGLLLPYLPLEAVILASVIVIAGAVMCWKSLRDTREGRQYDRAAKAWNESVKAKWENLHYCHHCDRVFTPGASPAMSPEDWRKSLGTSPHDRYCGE